MLILHSFEENKLEFKDEDKVEIKMMGTRIDKESLEHNLYENDITSIIYHNFSPTSNPPIKPKDSGSFRMKAHLEKKRTRSQLYNKSDEENSHTVAGDGVRVFREVFRVFLVKCSNYTTVLLADTAIGGKNLLVFFVDQVLYYGVFIDVDESGHLLQVRQWSFDSYCLGYVAIGLVIRTAVGGC
ncbi:hypothetical protein Tco_0576627 [Tanacetum coccineum]